MKKIFIITFLVFSTGLLYSYDKYLELIKTDIQEMQVEQAREHLENFASALQKKGLSSARKRALYSQLGKSALERKETLKKQRGIFKSRKDFVRCIGGLLLMTSVVTVPVVGLFLMDSQGSREKNTKLLGKYGILGTVLSCVGGKLAWDGFQLKAQQEELNKAQDIEKLISAQASLW